MHIFLYQAVHRSLITGSSEDQSKNDMEIELQEKLLNHFGSVLSRTVVP